MILEEDGKNETYTLRVLAKDSAYTLPKISSTCSRQNYIIYSYIQKEKQEDNYYWFEITLNGLNLRKNLLIKHLRRLIEVVKIDDILS